MATTVTSTNSVPIVVERAMYWPGGFFDYYEGHVSAGSTATARRWVVTGGEHDGRYHSQTFVLIANTSVSFDAGRPDAPSRRPARPVRRLRPSSCRETAGRRCRSLRPPGWSTFGVEVFGALSNSPNSWSKRPSIGPSAVSHGAPARTPSPLRWPGPDAGWRRRFRTPPRPRAAGPTSSFAFPRSPAPPGAAAPADGADWLDTRPDCQPGSLATEGDHDRPVPTHGRIGHAAPRRLLADLGGRAPSRRPRRHLGDDRVLWMVGWPVLFVGFSVRDLVDRGRPH